MKDVVLIGGGGHCESVIDVIEQEGKYKIAGIIDKEDLVGGSVLGYPVIACDDDLFKIKKSISYAVITVGQIGGGDIRRKLYSRAKEIGFTLPLIISPHSYVSRHAYIKDGTVIMHGAIVNVNAKIGENCIINTKSLIEHDVVVEDHCHISTGSILNGGVVVRTGSFLGSNSICKQCVNVPENSFIKAHTIYKGHS